MLTLDYQIARSVTSLGCKTRLSINNSSPITNNEREQIMYSELVYADYDRYVSKACYVKNNLIIHC